MQEPGGRRRHGGAQAGETQVYAVASAFGDESLAVDEKVRVMEPRWCGPGDAFGDGDDQQPGQGGGGDGVDHEGASRSQHPARLGDGRSHVGDMLEDLPRAHHVGDPVGQRQCRYLPAHRAHAVVSGSLEGRPGQVDAEVPVAEAGDVGGQQPGPAADIDEHGARPARRRHETGARLGDPVQHGEGPPRFPPLIDKVVVLRGVVAGARCRDRHPQSVVHRPSLPRPSAYVEPMGGGPQTRRRAIVTLLRAGHPEPTVAVTVFAVALAAATGRHGAGVVAVGTAVLAGHLAVGWHNDWLDAERDLAAGRTDKPVVTGAVSRMVVGRAAAFAAVAVVPLSLLSGWRAGLAHLAAVALALAYNARLKSSVASIVAYGVAFPLLVVFISLGGPAGRWPPWWALVAAALLGCGAHLVNAAPDLADDVAAGVRGLPQRLGYRRSVSLAVLALLAATVVVTFGPGRPAWGSVVALVAAVVVVGVGVALGRRPGSRLLFRSALVVALIDVVVLVARGQRL